MRGRETSDRGRWQTFGEKNLQENKNEKEKMREWRIREREQE
jgi:hypothetical protein